MRSTVQGWKHRRTGQGTTGAIEAHTTPMRSCPWRRSISPMVCIPMHDYLDASLVPNVCAACEHEIRYDISPPGREEPEERSVERYEGPHRVCLRMSNQCKAIRPNSSRTLRHPCVLQVASSTCALPVLSSTCCRSLTCRDCHGLLLLRVPFYATG